jgi:hypothetical protein
MIHTSAFGMHLLLSVWAVELILRVDTAASLMIGLWGFSHVPIAAAAWDVVCTTTT